MTTKEAKQIIASIVNWQFKLMGAIRSMPEPVDLKKYSLLELLEANKIVIVENKLISRNKSNGTLSIMMACEDRLIAAVYACLHYEAGEKAIAMVDNKIIGIIKNKNT